MSDLKSKFLEVYPILKQQLLNDPAFEFTDDSRQWLDHLLDYNVPRGKLDRGLSVVNCYKALNEGKELGDQEIFHACVLGWCIEWLQACAVILDDIMDKSHMRRGQPCWYTLPKVGMIAINDAIILRNHVTRILKMYFREKPYYVDLLDLFSEVEFQSACGEMIDLISTNEGEKDLLKYTLELYRRIAEYKGTYYSIYLPLACALVMAGEDLSKHSGVKSILVEMTIYFQVQDDYIDCFGDPEITGKVGTDIEDCKCSWLVVKALECANEEQKKLLHENYGKADRACVAKVKQVYEALDLQGMYAEYERTSYENITKTVKTSNKAVQALWQVYIRRRKLTEQKMQKP